MKKIFALLLPIAALTGCVSADANGNGPFRVADIVPGCRVLYFGDEVVSRPGAAWRSVYATGKCPGGLQEQKIGLTKVQSIESFGTYARIGMTDKHGTRTMTVRRSAFPYGKEKFSFIAYWPNGNPFL